MHKEENYEEPELPIITNTDNTDDANGLTDYDDDSESKEATVHENKDNNFH